MIVEGFFQVTRPFDSGAASRIAVRDMEALSRRRLGDGVGCPVRFESEPALPSFEVRFEGGELVIAAPDAVEALYGVYDFCEKFLGYFFWAPGVDLLTATGPIELSEGVLIPARKPLLPIRGFIQEFPFNEESPALADWMGKNKLNYLNVWMKYYDKLDQQGRHDFLDRGIEVQSGHHNFNYWIPAKEYGQTHPEFFAERNGQRIKPSTDGKMLLLSEQLCTTNQELRQTIADRMVAYAEENPEIRTVALIPNDGFGWCECPECSKFYDKNKRGDLYSVSDHVYLADRIYHDMIQDVARRLAEKRPDLKLNLCAYVNYCRPSKGFNLTPNMSVSVAPYWRCINHRIDDPSCPINSHYDDDIKAWVQASTGGDVIIYEYFMGVNFYLSLPMIHHHEMFKEVRHYADIGVNGLMTQFHVPHWSVYGINYRAMADATRGEDENASVRRMLTALFGQDAAEAEALYKAMRQMLLSVGPCHVPYPYSLLNRTKLSQVEDLLTQAKALQSKAPQDALRRDMVVWCEYMVRFKKLFDAYHAQGIQEEDIDAFLDWIHAHRDGRVFVHEKFDMFFAAWKEAIREHKPWLHFNLDWEDAVIRRHEKLLNGVVDA